MIRFAVDAVAGMLADADFTSVFTTVPSALLCAEPIVVRWESFERESRQCGEERGTAAVEVLVVREAEAEAMAVALAAEQAVRASGRAAWNEEDAGARIVGIDAEAPVFKGQDASGRCVWGFRALLTVARET